MLQRRKSQRGALLVAIAMGSLVPWPVAAASGGDGPSGNLVSVPSLSAAGARRVLERALAEARTRNENVCVVVLNAAGDLRLAECMEQASPVAYAIAFGKAETAVAFRANTQGFEKAVESGAAELLAAPRMMPIDGGAPVMAGDRIVGAVGVCGARSDIDGMMAVAAAAAIAAEKGQ